MMRLSPIALALLLSLSACSGGVDRNYYEQLDYLMTYGESGDAADVIKAAGKETYGERNRLLYHLDMGLALQVAHRFTESEKQFAAADSLAADLYTKSLSGEAASLFTSDNEIPYYGEEFERILLNVFNGLNYAYEGDFEDALVEVRRIDVKFRALETEGASRYSRDPFALYVSGMLYENQGLLDDARIAYTDAVAAYDAQAEAFEQPTPEQLKLDLARFETTHGRTVPPGEGEIVVLHYFGPGPRKIERVVEVSVGQGFVFVQAMDVRDEDQKGVQQALSAAKGIASDTQVTVAYPVFEQPEPACWHATTEVAGCRWADSVQVENISAIARLNLEDRMDRTWPRYVARAVLKFVVSRVAGTVGESVSGNEGVGLLVQLFTQAALSAAEAADVRGWRTLPAVVHMTRLVCDPGTYDVEVTQHGLAGRFGSYVEISDVPVFAGKRTFLFTACY